MVESMVEGFMEKVRFEFRVEKSSDDGRDELIWLGWDEEKKNDQDEVDGMRQELFQKHGNAQRNEWLLKSVSELSLKVILAFLVEQL